MLNGIFAAFFFLVVFVVLWKAAKKQKKPYFTISKEGYEGTGWTPKEFWFEEPDDDEKEVDEGDYWDAY
jgi:hypothetical protein